MAPPARFACAVPAAPRALPGRGACTPRPPGLRPLARLRAPGPRCLGHPAGGVPGTGAAVAVFGLRGNFKKLGGAKRCGGFGGRAPRCRAAVGNPAQAVGGQGAAVRLCPPSTDWARLSTGDRV